MSNIITTLPSVDQFHYLIIIRVLMAALCGAIIGFERAHAQRPAGIRTHVLVCVSSCLCMLTGEYIFNTYHHISGNMDISRLGAQVISGVGFLGAGTIIRNGTSIKGLTTAASIWAVACIGLAIGIGFYSGAMIATILIILILACFKKVFGTAFELRETADILIKFPYSREYLDTIKNLFYEKGISIKNINFKHDKENVTSALVTIITNPQVDIAPLLEEIYNMPNIHEVTLKEFRE